MTLSEAIQITLSVPGLSFVCIATILIVDRLYHTNRPIKTSCPDSKKTTFDDLPTQLPSYDLPDSAYVENFAHLSELERQAIADDLLSSARLGKQKIAIRIDVRTGHIIGGVS